MCSQVVRTLTIALSDPAPSNDKALQVPDPNRFHNYTAPMHFRTGVIPFVLVLFVLALSPTATMANASSADGLVSWGNNTDGQLGDGTLTNGTSPAPVSGGLAFAQIAGGATHACGLTQSGVAYCWGDNREGQLGNGAAPTDSLTPTPVYGGLTFSDITAGQNFTCAITTTGAAYCWGDNTHGQLGDGTTADKSVPTAVIGGLTFSTISVGYSHTCALNGSGAVYCWGYNQFGQIGNGTTTTPIPSPTASIGGGVYSQLSVGGYHTCAVTAAGAASCWGRNDKMQTGIGGATPNQSPITTPTAVAGGHVFRSISAGAEYTCGVSTSGTGLCWGQNDLGQIGDGVGSDQPTANPIAGGYTLTSLTTSGYSACAITLTNEALCWGYNGEGQVGDGTSSFTPVVSPTAVSGGFQFSRLWAGSTSQSMYGLTGTDVPAIGDTITPVFTEFTFRLPTGEECSAISPIRVQVGTMVQLPGSDANCRTMEGATIYGWTIPVPPESNEFGSKSSPFPAGQPVRVIDAQQFTVVPFESVLTFFYDANVANGDTCINGDTNVESLRGSFTWVPRGDVSIARFPSSAECAPPGHRLMGWSTSGSSYEVEYGLGDPLPEAWGEDPTNVRALFAVWSAA